MPNWAENILTVVGKKEDVNEFIEKFKGFPPMFEYKGEDWEGYEKQVKADIAREGKKFCMNALVPVPDDVLEQGFDMAGYNWCVENWGTKWDIWGDVDLQGKSVIKDKMWVLFTFDTAWGPPAEWVKKVGKMFPKLDFSLVYKEEGMAFAGMLQVEGGEVVDVYEIDISAGELFDDFIWEYFGEAPEDRYVDG